MAHYLLGSVTNLLLFFAHHWVWTIVLLVIGATLVHFARCAKRGVCPFPHRKKRSADTTTETVSRRSETARTGSRERRETVGSAVETEVAGSAIYTEPAGSTLDTEAAPQAKTPVQTTVPLAADDPIRADLFAELQGNILSGHGRDHAVHLFIKFDADSATARSWLRKTAETYVVSAAVQHKRARAFKRFKTDGGIFGHIAVSAAGYGALGFTREQFPLASNPRARSERQGYSDVFASGMKARQRYLLDPEVKTWDEGFRNEIHILVILAGDDADSVNKAAGEVIASLSGTTGGAIGTVVATENGMGLTRQLDADDPSTVAHVEHFGYVDGRSQPLFLEEQVDGEKTGGGISKWDPSAPLSLALVRDPLGKCDSSFGSFLVFRKLEQNVRGWNKAVGALAAELGVEDELAGAMAMGRFKDGTPVVEQGRSGRTDVHNNFNFADDSAGRRCPFQAHIRKANPRGEAVGEGDLTVEAEREHRIVRRGIPYGGELTTSLVPEEQPEGGVGLLFFCYQGDIWEQFEFIQRRWCNNPYFLQPQKSKEPGYDATGLDPVVGQAHPESKGAARAAESWPKGWGEEPTKVKAQLANFVTMKGGEYFFSPSMSFLLGL